jgi:hypothetical protein
MKRFLLLLSVVALAFTGCYENPVGPDEPVVEDIVADEPIEYVDDEPVLEDTAAPEKEKKTFLKRKKEVEPEVIKPMSLADMRKNKKD